MAAHYRHLALVPMLLGAVLWSASTARAGGMIVYDPVNAIHNAATAARALESLQNQVRQLQNEAQSLARSPLAQSGDIGQSLASLSALSKQVSGLTSNATQLETQFAALYPGNVANSDPLKLVQAELDRLQAARQTAHDLAQIAAGVTGGVDGQQHRAAAALGASEGSGGQTAAVQSSTQLMGVLAEQLASLQTLTAAQARLAAEQAANAAQDQAMASEAHRRLWAHDAVKPAAPSFDPFPQAQR